MINFFHKIRQKLLAEKKTGKYLKYAFGEIILVVIGILIALQINNWNEIRKSNLDLKNRLDLMHNELINDITFYQELIAGNQKRINFLTKLSKQDFTEINLTSIALIISKNFDPRNFGTTYYSIKEAGQLNKITDTALKEQIVNYYESTCVDFNNFSEWHRKFVTENIDNYILENLDLDLNGNAQSSTILKELNGKKLPNIVNFQAVILKRFNNLCSDNIKLTSSLISQINKEIKK